MRFIIGYRLDMAPEQRTKEQDRRVSTQIVMTCHIFKPFLNLYRQWLLLNIFIISTGVTCIIVVCENLCYDTHKILKISVAQTLH